MRKFLLIIILPLCLNLGCKKDILNNPFREDITINGKIYFDRTLRPMPFVDLVLYDVNVSSRSGKPKAIAYATSDINGDYEFFYEFKDSYSELYIAKDHSGNYGNQVLGILADALPANLSLNLDLYKEPFGTFKIKVEGSKPLSTGDTLYVGGLHSFNRDSFYRENLLGTGRGGFAFPFPLITDEFGPFHAYRLPNFGSPTFYDGYYGVGKDEFLAAFSGDSTKRGSIGILPPPQVTYFRIKLN